MVVSIFSSSIDSQTKYNELIRCNCGVEPLIWTSTKSKLKGLKFYVCPFHRDGKKYCLLVWFKIVDELSEVIQELEIDKAA